MQYPDSSSRRATRRRLRDGSRTLSGSFTSSTCVQFILLDTCELTSPFQTELAIDTNIVVPNTRLAVADAHAVVSDTHTMVADIHRSVSTGQEGSSSTKHSVGTIYHPLTTDFLPSHRLKSGQDIEYYRIPGLTIS